MTVHGFVVAFVKALRSSEFWVLLAQAVVEVASMPVPEEYKAIAWFYIGARVLSKLAKWIFQQPQEGGE